MRAMIRQHLMLRVQWFMQMDAAGKSWMIILVLAGICGQVSAQELKVNGGFLSDSLKVGEQTGYFLSIHHPAEVNVLFPDSAFSFGPFEWQSKKYFPTRTDAGISIDSAVYYLTTFEVDRVQFLELPVFILQAQDCTAMQSLRDSVLLTQLVAVVPDSLTADKLPLKMNTAFQDVHYDFNFWILLMAVGALVIIGVIVWIFFGKQIRAYVVTRRLQRKHFQFQTAYNSLVSKLNSGFSSTTTELAISTWKKYMEQLESRPYTKLTTKETFSIVKDESLAKNLSQIDAAVYGHNTSVMDSLQNLRNFADQRFSKKMEEIKHG